MISIHEKIIKKKKRIDEFNLFIFNFWISIDELRDKEAIKGKEKKSRFERRGNQKAKKIRLDICNPTQKKSSFS